LAAQDSTLTDAGTQADRELVAAVASGSSEALARLYDRHAGTVFALARRLLSLVEDAEEVVQDVFSQVWRDASRYEAGRATVAGWIVMLTRARAIDRLRSRKARPDLRGVNPDSAPPLVAGDRNPEQVTLTAEDVRSVRGALTVLPDAQRSLLELAYYEGMTHVEIAERTGVPLGTVKTRIRTAMMTLKGVLSS